MKKLMTMIAAVGMAFGLFAETVGDSGTSFEGTSGGALADLVGSITELSQEGLGGWGANLDGATVVSFVDTGVGKYAQSERSEKFDNSNNWFLNLKTNSKEVTRYAIGSSSSYDVLDELDKRYYVDTVVQMTAFDETPAVDGAKLALWLQEVEATDTVAGETNLWLKVGAGDPINLGNKPGLIGAWARMTIKVLPINESQIGFVLFINKTAVTLDDYTVTATGLTPVAQAYAEAHQLIVSTAQDTTIASLGFQGQGYVDDIVFTQDMGDETFANDPAACVVKWPTDGSVTAVTIGGVPVEDLSAGQKLIVFPADFESITVAWTGDDTHKNGSYTIESADETEVDIGDALEDAVAKIGDEKYGTLAEAAAQAAGETIVLVADVNESVSFAADDATLDLAGFTVTGTIAEGEEAVGAAIYVASGSLNIIDSDGAGVVNKGDEDVAVDVDEGVVAIAAGKFVGGAYGDGSGTFTGGKFDEDPSNDVAEGYKVGPQDGEGFYPIVPDTSFTVTVNAAAEGSRIASIVVDDVPVEEPAAGDFDAEQRIVVTYEANEGYRFVDPTLAEQSFTEDGETEVPTVEKINYVAEIDGTKYETLQGALTAAENGDTVIVLAGITDEELSFGGTDKSALKITISNDFNVVWTKDTSASYGFLINGATVTFTGSGTWAKTAGSASIIQAGATTPADIIVTSGTFIGGEADVDTAAAPSNLIASKSGDITVDGGTFINYRGDQGRCVRAEGSDKGNAKATINGGYFTVCCTNDAQLAKIESKHICVDNKGLATGSVVINSGYFKMPEVNVTTIINANGWCGKGFKLKLNGEGWYVRTAIQYATLKLTSDAGVKTLTATNAAGEVFNDGATFDKDLAVKLYACYELNESSVQLDADKSVLEATMDQDEVEIAVYTKALVPEYDPTSDDPEKIPDNETAATRYGDKVPATLADVSAKTLCTWAKGNGKLASGATILEDAFLLNCENDPTVVEEAKKNFKATSITINSDGTVTVGKPEGYNGTIKTLGKAELSDAEWSDDLAGKKFFELKLVPTNLN